MARLRQRIAREESGFTLIELLVVIVIIGILLAIAVPSYLGFRTRAQESAALANVRAAVPSAEAFYSDNGTYDGMTDAALKLIDQGLNVNFIDVSETDSAYCLTGRAAAGGAILAYYKGPGGAVTKGAACP
jgi:type IV pilus assembly protein PilA